MKNRKIGFDFLIKDTLLKRQSTLMRVLICLFALCLILSGCKGVKREAEDRPGGDEGSQVTQGQQPVEVRAVVDNASPVAGDMITYTLTVDADKEISPRIPEMGARISGLRIVDIGAEGPKEEAGGRNVWKRWYKLQADLVGSYIIPPARVTYQDPNGKDTELTAPQVFIEVKSGLKEGEGHGDILDIKPLEESGTDPLYLYILAGAGFFLLILAGAGIWLWYGKKGRIAAGDIPPPDETALSELEALMASKYIEQEDYRFFYFRLSGIFRAYMEAQFGFPARESTTEELIPRIEKLDLTRRQKDTVRLLTRWEDLVKFARHLPTSDKAQKDWEDTRQLILDIRQKTLNNSSKKEAA